MSPTHRSVRQTAAVLALAVACVAACGMGTAIADDPRLSASVTAGFGGSYVVDRWMPVTVKAENAGGEFVGELRVVVATWGTDDVASMPVTLPSGSRKQFGFELLGRRGPLPRVRVQLRNPGGRELAAAAASLTELRVPTLWVVFGSSWLGLEPLSRGEGKIRAVRAAADEAPHRPLGYAAVDAVFVGPPDSAHPWSREDRAALLAWVRDGGRAIVHWKTLADGFFPEVDGRSGDWRESTVSAADLADAAGGAPPPAADPVRFTCALPGAGSVGPGLQSLAYGLGEILIAGWAPDQAPMREWPGAPGLWANILGQSGDRDAAGGTALIAATALESTPLATGPAKTALAMLLLVHGLGLSVGAALHVRRARAPVRRGVAAVWVILAAGTAVAIVLGLLARPELPAACVVHAVRGVAGGDLRGTSLAALPFPAGGSIDVAVAGADAAVGLTGQGRERLRPPDRRMARQEADAAQGPGGIVMRGVQAARGDLLVVLADWRARVPWLDAIRWTVEDGALRIKNGSDRRLQGMWAWHAGRGVVGSLGPGEETLLDPRTGSEAPEGRYGIPLNRWLLDAAFTSAIPPRQTTTAAEVALYALLAPPDAFPRRARPQASVLFLRTDADPAVVRIDGYGTPPSAHTFVELQLER